MRTITLEDIPIEEILGYLSSYYSRVLKKIWREGDRINAVFIHEKRVVRINGYYTISTIVEYDQSIEKGLCTIVVSGGSSGAGFLGMDLGSQEAEENTLRKRIESLINPNPNIMGNRRYCMHCKKWDDYKIKSGQTEVICKRCGQSISLEKN